ncbi:MAG: ABC transporter substrate-binding protein [Chloroflexota bacterium]|nr:ABC transporter substrate-binding protein [Chloroflexota bacterium]
MSTQDARILSRRQVVAGAAGLGLAAPFVRFGAMAAQDATPAAAGVPGGILKVGLQADPTSLDAQTQNLTAIWHVAEHIYQGLTRIKPDLSVEPSLAESWEISEDGLTYTFKMRPGVNFHDGTPLKASDVVFTIERLRAPETASPGASELASIDTIEAPDDATVVITLSRPDASLLAALAGGNGFIYSEAFVTANNNDMTQVAMGTGPFKFVEYVPNTRVVLEKNPDYWEEGLPYLDGIEMTIASEDTARTAAVVTGTVDFIEYAPLRDIDSLQQNPDITLAGDSNTNIRFAGLNLAREPFDKPEVREAISLVVDRTAMLGPTVFGHGTPTAVLFPPDYWAALQVEVPATDIERAKQLLADAGLPDGFQTTITSWSQYSFLSNAAVVLQEQLRQIGIEAELNLVENATLIQQVYTDKEFDIAVTGDSAYVDPNTLILPAFKTDESGNFVSYSNPEVDELIDAGIAATDQEARAEIYRQIQQILLEDRPWIPFFVANQYEAMRNNVKGYVHIPTGSNIAFRETWIES